MQLPPTFATVEEERLHRKQKLAGALRIFGRLGFGEGVAGHITVRDPEFPDHFWVNPFGMSFRHIRVSDLILVNHAGDVVYGKQPVNRAAFVIHAAIHQARPDVVAAAHTPLASRQGVQLARHPARPDHPGRLHLLRGPRRDRRAGRRGRVRDRGRQGARRQVPDRQGGDPPEPRPVHGRRDGRRGGVLVHHHGALVPGPADGDGGRHAEADPPRVSPSTPPSRPASRSPDGSASSRCGRRSAAPIPSCSTDTCRRARARAAAPDLAGTRPRLARSAVRALGVVAVHRRGDRGVGVRRGRTADGRLVARSSVPPSRCSRSSRADPPRLDPSPAARRGDVRRGDRADEHVLLPRHRSHRPRQGRGDRVHRPDRGRRGDDADSRNAVALVLAVVGVATLGGVEIGDNAARSGVHPRRVGDVGRLHRRRITDRPARPRPRRLGVGLAIGALALDAVRRAVERAGVGVAGAARAVPARPACSRTRSATASISTCCAASRSAASRCCSRCCRSPRSWSAGSRSTSDPSLVDLVGISLVLAGVGAPGTRRDRRRRRARLNVNRPCDPRPSRKARTADRRVRNSRRSTAARPPSTPPRPPA